MSADAVDEYQNSILAAGGVFALLWDAVHHHNALEAVEVVTDADGNATNEIEISLSFMNSPYRLTVERVQPAAERPTSAQRAELTALMASVSMRSAGDIASMLGLLLSFVPIHDWAGLEMDLRTEFGVPGPAIVPTDTAGQPE